MLCLLDHNSWDQHPGRPGQCAEGAAAGGCTADPSLADSGALPGGAGDGEAKAGHPDPLGRYVETLVEAGTTIVEAAVV